MIDDTLNVQISKVLGWRVEERHDKGEIRWSGNRYFVLLTPDGTQQTVFDTGMDRQVREWFTEVEAWDCGPDFEHSLDTVLAVLPPDYAVEIHRVVDLYFSRISDRFHNVMGSNNDYGTETRQEAAAHALLALLQAEGMPK